MGISRSGSTTIAYLMRENMRSLEETLSDVVKHRNCVKPNPGFMKQLKHYEQIIQNKQNIELQEVLNNVDITTL